jgi:hypothetical protein
VRSALGFALALFALGCAGHCACTPAMKNNVENAAALTQYERLLDDCRAKGKDAGSYAVYSACADQVDAHLCKDHGLRCGDDIK